MLSDRMPSRNSIFSAMAEYCEIGSAEFHKKYTSNRFPRFDYLKYEGMYYPTRALWAASHNPPISARSSPTNMVRIGFSRLGFANFVKIHFQDAHYEPRPSRAAKTAEDIVEEGERAQRESSFIKRNATIVKKAKTRANGFCEACSFNFGKFYGKIGEGFIEAHHKEELSLRRGHNSATSVDDFAMLCANCHRMVHRTIPCMSIEDLVLKILKRKQ